MLTRGPPHAPPIESDQAEVRQADLESLRRHDGQDVRRLDVSVHHAAGVGVGQGIEQGEQDVSDLSPFESSAVGGEGSRRELHHQERRARAELALGLTLGGRPQAPDVQHLDDGRVVETGDRVNLSLEVLDAVCDSDSNDLDGHRNPERGVLPAPHLSHAPRAYGL